MAIPEWLKKDKSVREKSDRKTKKFAKKHNIKVRSNSGAPWNMKGDLGDKNALIEHKYTDKKQFIIKEKMLKKIFTEAIKDDGGKEPYFVIEFKKYVIIGKVSRK